MILIYDRMNIAEKYPYQVLFHDSTRLRVVVRVSDPPGLRLDG